MTQGTICMVYGWGSQQFSIYLSPLNLPVKKTKTKPIAQNIKETNRKINPKIHKQTKKKKKKKK
jgi:hypothetical protein